MPVTTTLTASPAAPAGWSRTVRPWRRTCAQAGGQRGTADLALGALPGDPRGRPGDQQDPGCRGAAGRRAVLRYSAEGRPGGSVSIWVSVSVPPDPDGHGGLHDGLPGGLRPQGPCRAHPCQRYHVGQVPARSGGVGPAAVPRRHHEQDCGSGAVPRGSGHRGPAQGHLASQVRAWRRGHHRLPCRLGDAAQTGRHACCRQESGHYSRSAPRGSQRARGRPHRRHRAFRRLPAGCDGRVDVSGERGREAGGARDAGSTDTRARDGESVVSLGG
mmetsp:Transcript_13839/g.25766  ORF Transcript_13839/g.25766 Transcript_13839/m.25766 type:complete len:273 (-) Transcript_13839:230-1048(-)